MRIVIIGAGGVGSHLAKQLIDENHQVTIVEPDDEVVYQLRNRLDCLIIHDEGNNIAALEQAAASEADFLITVTHSDELNLLICGMIKAHDGKPVKISRIRSIRYSSPETYFESFNVDCIVNPALESAHAVIRAIETKALSDVLEFARASLQIRNITIDEQSPLCDKQVKSIIPLIEVPFLFSLIYRDNQCIIPNGDDVLQEGDVVYIAADSDDFAQLYRDFNIKVERMRKIVIAGGGHVGRLIARHILRDQQHTLPDKLQNLLHRSDLSIVEANYSVARKLADEFPNALIVHGDISNSELFIEEDFSSADLFIATTSNEEINLLSATYGKSIGIKKTMVVVSKTNYPIIAHTLKIDAAVSIKNTVINAILRRIHRRQISTIHSLLDGMIEVLELDVGAKSKVINKKLMDIRLPDQSIILNITRNKSEHIPRGEFTIRENDQIIVIVSKECREELRSLITGALLA